MSGRKRPAAIVSDYGAMLSSRADGALEIVPLTILSEGREFKDGVELAAGDFYRKLEEGHLPTTSTPSPGSYLEAFHSVGSDEIVCLTIPPGLSAMYEAATIARDLLREQGDTRPVHIVDTRTAAAGHGLVVRIAAEMAARGARASEIIERIDLSISSVRMFGALTTLEYLARSGRVPTLVASVGNLLGVRPVFEMRLGEAHRVGLARTERRVIHLLAHEAAAHYPRDVQIRLLVFDGASPHVANDLLRVLSETCAVSIAERATLTPVMGAYTGPGTIGFAAVVVDDEARA